MIPLTVGISLVSLTLGIGLGAFADNHEALQTPTVVIGIAGAIAGLVLIGFGLARVLA